MKKRTKICKTAAVLFLLLCLSLLSLSVFAVQTVTLSVTVRVTGAIPDLPETYTVRLTPVGQAPMPEVCTADHLDMMLSGAGTVQFPPIAFQTVGVYHYTVTQVAGAHPDAHYDTGIYDLTVTVTNSDDGNGFDLTVTIIQNGRKQDAAIFLNDYGTHSGENDPTEPVTEPPSDRPEDGPTDVPPTDPDPTSPGTMIQTGQHREVICLLGGTGAVLAVLGGLLMYRGRKKDRDAE